jgi:hypothetical protein
VLVYVHGSGHQDPPEVLHERLDRVVFGGPNTTSRLAYYANVLHGEPHPSAFARLRAAAPARRPSPSPFLTQEQTVALRVLAGDEESRGRITALRERWQRHEDATTTDRPGWLEREAFRVLLGTLLPDVGRYFFGGHAEAMREPLREVLRSAEPPISLVSHSLGTIISYHVLGEPEFAGLEVAHWLTLGSPLAIDEVRWLATKGLARPAPAPSNVLRWTNVADPLDPVALDGTVADEYGPADRIEELRVSIRCRMHHAMKAYLAHDQVRGHILEAVAPTPP